MQGLSGNAAKSGIKVGDTVVYASSFFGEELWPADSVTFVNTALNRAPSPVYIQYVRLPRTRVLSHRSALFAHTPPAPIPISSLSTPRRCAARTTTTT